MVAYSFKAWLRQPILDGTKGGTIRNDRKRHARPGEELQLYTGMRTRTCQLIARKICIACDPIRLNLARGRVSLPALDLVLACDLDTFARFDGFDDWTALCNFWRAEHDAIREFSGQNIRWLPLPEGLR